MVYSSLGVEDLEEVIRFYLLGFCDDVENDVFLDSYFDFDFDYGIGYESSYALENENENESGPFVRFFESLDKRKKVDSLRASDNSPAGAYHILQRVPFVCLLFGLGG